MKPRAPKTREPLDIAVEFLRGQDGDALREVADMLEDIAEGRWTLVDEAGRQEAGLPEL